MGGRMERIVKNKGISAEKIVFVTKCMLGAYLLTAGLLLLLAFVLYRFGLSEKVVSVCIIGIYIAVTFLLGFAAGKRMEKRRFLWGLVMGSCYYVILLLVSLVVNHGISDIAGNALTVLFLCTGSGMLGGMLS